MNKGFTLIELMVCIAIVAILSAVVFVSFRGGEERLSLQRSIYILAQDLRRAQEMALAATEQEGGVPQGGYGIYFSDEQKKQYVFFADKDGDGQKDSGEEFEVIKLPKKIELAGNSLYWNILTIIFRPPDPTTIVGNAAGPSTQSQVTIFLRQEGGVCPDDCQGVNVNTAGRIEIE